MLMSNFFLNIFLIKKYFYKNKPTRKTMCHVLWYLDLEGIFLKWTRPASCFFLDPLSVLLGFMSTLVIVLNSQLYFWVLEL